MEPPEPCAEPAAFGDTLHIHYTVRGLGAGAGTGRGRGPDETRQLWLGHVASSLGVTQGSGVFEHVVGEGRSSLRVSPPCFSSSSSWALRSERWRDRREVPTLWGFLFPSARRGALGCSS